MLVVECPHCGPRNASEFRFGGEYNPRPEKPMQSSEEEWTRYLYLRKNRMGTQSEWWYHNAGCGAWFLAERDTRTSQIGRTYIWSPQARGETDNDNE